jgi:LysM repeat protein
VDNFALIWHFPLEYNFSMRRRNAILLILLGMLAFACRPVLQTLTATASLPARTLAPYSTITPTAPRVGTPTSLPNLQPTATVTPRSYTIRLGDTFSSIALNYGVTINDLILANPDLDPNALVVGQVVSVPAPRAQAGSTSGNPTPTAIPLALASPDCYPSLEGGVWCFLLVRNDNAGPVENMTAVIHVAGISTGEVYSQTAVAPLDLIPAGGSLPLVAYFPAPMPQQFQASAELSTAFSVPDGNTRYLPAHLDDTSTAIAANGLSAAITGQVIVDGGTSANLVWLAATAFDADGHVVGVRRWESTQALAPGQPLSFSLNVYSSAGAITRVELALEVRP